MKFAAPAWLFILPLLLAGLLGLWTWSGRRARRILQSAFNTPLLPSLLRSLDFGRRWLKFGLFAAAIAALLAAVARPLWGRAEIEVDRTGVDLVIALDVSRSMLAKDAGSTNRLAAAVDAIERLVSRAGGDRLGLVMFAGEAYMLAPLTRDHVAIERALHYAAPNMISEQGSNLGEAIKRARETFDRAAQGPRVLLVVSDGEQLQGNAVDAAAAALREGIHVHAAGIGSSAGAPVPPTNNPAGGFLRNALGREVVSRRDEQLLRRIARAGGGRYTRVEGPRNASLADWFEHASASLPRTTEKRSLNEPREQFQWSLAIALVALMAEWTISDRKRSSTAESL